MLVCDAQVHSPNPRLQAPVPGLDCEELIQAMDATGVDRAVIVPLEGDSRPSIDVAARAPHRLRVMPLAPVGGESETLTALETMRSQSAVVGIRVSAFAEPTRSLLADDKLDWLFAAASRLGLVIALNTMGDPAKLSRVARRFPDARFLLDHLGLEPFRTYDDLTAAIDQVVLVASCPNVAVKATCVPAAVREAYPFPSLHAPLLRVINAFGPARVFWGSDVTRLPCSYVECKQLFIEALGLAREELEQVMGMGLCEWIGWPPPSSGEIGPNNN
jgi:L-fuconolactonase